MVNSHVLYLLSYWSLGLSKIWTYFFKICNLMHSPLCYQPFYRPTIHLILVYFLSFPPFFLPLSTFVELRFFFCSLTSILIFRTNRNWTYTTLVMSKLLYLLSYSPFLDWKDSNLRYMNPNFIAFPTWLQSIQPHPDTGSYFFPSPFFTTFHPRLWFLPYLFFLFTPFTLCLS